MIEAHGSLTVLRGRAAGGAVTRFRPARLRLMRGRAAGGARTAMRNGGVDGSRGGSTAQLYLELIGLQ